MYLSLRQMKNRLLTIAGHVAGWIFFFSLVIGFLSSGPQEGHNVWASLFSPPFLIFYTVFLFLFYFNYGVLIPRLFLARKYLLYFSITIVMLAAVFYIKPFDRLISMNHPPDMPRGPAPPGMEKMGPEPRKQFDINSIIMFVTIWSLSTVIPLARQWRLTEQRAAQAEAERAYAELASLKSQVNPHFLFNTLNNIYSMAVTHHANTAPSIMKLSNIMRYVTDEVQADFVPLDSEISCMQDYIDLQRMRLGEKMQVNLSVTGQTANKQIAPLILMTFTENVFKYGVSSHEPSVISIRLSADEHSVTFFCQNKHFESRKAEERKGTGIPNARKRLQHLYPDKHFLDINTDNGLFTVQLTLQA